MKREALLRAVAVMANCGKERPVAEALQASGFGASEARVLAGVLPEAFAVPVLEELAASRLNLQASAQNAAGEWIKIPLARNGIFLAAVDLAREHRSRAAMPHETYRSIAEGSALIDVASKILNSGSELKGVALAIALIGTRAEDFQRQARPKRWWQGLLANFA